jgi:hypothetical protein
MPLTDTKIRNQKPGTRPVRLTDGSGLYLLVQPTGSKLWRYRYRIAGMENLFALDWANTRRWGWRRRGSSGPRRARS